jgi:T1SS-143 domain-containing protein
MADVKQVASGATLESIGTVKTVVGTVKAVDQSGAERILQAGDKVYANETIVTADGGLVLIEFADGSHLDLASASQIILDTDVFNPANAAPKGEELTAEQIQEMIARGEDPTAVTEATAAGAGAGDEGGSSFIVVDFNNTQGDVTSGFNTLGIPGPESTTFTELPPVEDEPLTVIPDTVPTTEVTTVAVDEDDLGSYRGEESILGWWWTWQGNNDTAPGDDIVPDSTTVVSGVLNVTFGADVPGNVAFNAAGTQPALTSGGLPVQYFVSDDGLTIVGYVVYTDEYEEGTYEKPIFAATIDDPATGAFTFYLLGNIDHADPTTEDNFVLNLGYTATDSEGDAAAGILAVNIDDDSPVLGYSGCESFDVQSDNVYVPTAYVDEDDLKPGNDDSAGGDDWGYNPYTVYLPISFGADGPAAENALVLSTAGITDQNNQALTSGDQPLQYVWDEAAQTLTAYIGTVDSESYQEIFTLQVDYVGTYGAELLFTLKGPLDHPENNAESPEDNLVFNITYTAFDGDGDSVQGTLAVNVDDDSPVAGADSAVVFAGESVTIDVTGNDYVGADRPGTWSNGGSYTFDADGIDPGVYNDTYTLTDGDNDETTGNISVEVLGRPVVHFTDGETNVESLVVDEDGSVTVFFTAEAQSGSQLTALTVTGFNPAMGYDFSALGVEDADYTFDGTTLTILNLTGSLFEGSFEVTPPADSDVDVGTLTATATAAANADSNVTADSSNSVDVYTDAVADAPTIDINVVDGGDGNATFQANESGTVTVYATFGDSTDGSETHTVVVTVPAGFSVSDLPLGAVYDSNNNTVTFNGVGAVLDTSFTVTNTSSPDGVATFSGTASTEETTTSGEEPDLNDNTASDDDSANVGVSSIPTPSVTLAGAGADALDLKEDGSARTVSVTADTNAGSSLTQIVITGLASGFEYDFSGLDTDGVGGITVDTSVAGQVTITGLSGLTYSGSFTVKTGTEDSDVDLGTVNAEVTSASNSDPSVTANSSDSVTITTDAVLDDAVQVNDGSNSGTESTGAQVIGLNLTASVISPNGQTDAAPADATESGTATVTVTLPAGVVLGTFDGVTFTATATTFNGTPAQAEAWLESLAVQVPAGYDGTVNGSVSVTYTDTPTGDVETDATDNSYTDTATFSVTVAPSVGTPEVSTDIDGDYLVIKEDGSGTYHVTATSANATDKITQIEVSNLPAGAIITGSDGGSYNALTGIYTVNGTQTSVTLTVTVAGAEDTDVDLGTTTFTATAADITSPTTTTTSSTTATVVVDAVLDDAVQVNDGSNSGTESTGAQVIGLNLTASVISPNGQTDAAPADATESGTATVTVTLPAGVVLGTFDGVTFTATATTFNGTPAQAEAWLESLAVQVPAGYDGTVNGSVSVTYTDTPTGDVETDATDNSYTDTATFSVTVAPSVGTPEVSTDIDGDYLVIKEDGSGTYHVTATSANATDKITQIEVSNLPAGAIITGSDGGSYNALTGIYTVNGTQTSVTLTVTVAGAEDTDVDLGTTTFTATAADITSPTTTTTSSTTATVVVDAVLDQYGDVSASALSAINESASAQTVSLGLGMTIANAGFAGSLAGGADTDGSESISVNVSISAGTLSLAAGAPTGASVSYDVDLGKWVLTANNAADLATAVSKLQVTVAANFDGTITGTISSSATDAGANGVEVNTADNTKTDSANFSLTVNDGAPTSPVNDSITVEEESIPGIGGNNEADGLSYQVTNGDLSNNATWGPDGFGGVVSVNGVAANGSGHIIIDNATYTLDVVAATGAYTFTLKDNVNSGSTQGENTTSLPSFTVVAQDNGDNDQITFSLNVSVVDDVPMSSNDYGQVTLNANHQGSTSGNVVTNDSFGADGPLSGGGVTLVTFNGQTSAVTAGGTTVHGTYGDLLIKSDGTYTYTYTGTPSNVPVHVTPGSVNGATLTGYKTVSPYIGNGTDANPTDLNLSATADSTVSVTGGSKSGWAVGTSAIENGENLVVHLSEPITGAFSFQIGNYNANQSDLSAMTYAVYDETGDLITSGTFATLGGTANNNGTYTGAPIDLGSEAQKVAYIVFGNTQGNGQGYTVTDISYVSKSYPTGIDQFDYTITDSDGDTSSSSLYLTTDQYLNDAIVGGHTLTGGTGQDILLGNDGNDILIGGKGDDVLSGGTGADTFVWNSGDTGGDEVTDFSTSEGDILNVADLISDGLTMTAVAESGHLQLQFSDVGNNVVQTIDLNNVPVATNTDATNLMNQLLTNGNIVD